MDVQLYKILTNIIQQYIIDSVNPKKIRITCSKSINVIQFVLNPLMQFNLLI